MTPLRQRMLEDMQVRNLARNTQASYLQQVTQFARHFHQSPERLGPEEIRAYQVYLTTERQLAPGSILIAVAALRFLYTVTLQRPWRVTEILPAPQKPQPLPIVLSCAEVQQFLESVPLLKHRTILSVCYAAGLRISEALRLQAAHIDSRRMVLRVEQGKGQKDRYVMLSPKLLDLLRVWWRVAKPWPWLFPGRDGDRPITPKAVEEACQKAQRRCGIPKPITPHSLRHYLPCQTMSRNREELARCSHRVDPGRRPAPPITRHSLLPSQTLQEGQELVARLVAPDPAVRR
jgi:integrase/recombinase XerD